MITQTEYKQIQQFVKILEDVVNTTALSMDHLKGLVDRIDYTVDTPTDTSAPSKEDAVNA